VCIISTARKVSEEEILPAAKVLQSWGLEVTFGQNLFSECHQFAGSDLQRLSDLQQALDEPNFKAIFCARGGYGTPRIIDFVNWAGFAKSPKWVVGFSDVCTLLAAIQNQGVCALHAPMPLFFARPEYQPSMRALKACLFGEKSLLQAPPHPFNKIGATQGVMVGGNLSMIVNSIGTFTQFDPLGKILFLEDIDEYLYHIDRMMVHLKRAGVLGKIAGLVIGHFTDMKDNTVTFGENSNEIIFRNIADLEIPVAFGFEIGHAPQNLPLVVGQSYLFTVDESGARLEFL